MNMDLQELTGFLVSVGLIVIIALVVSASGMPRKLKYLVYAALFLRVAGSIARYVILFEFYGGSGDARLYYARGLEYSRRFIQFDLSPFYDQALWLRGQWTGTSFVSFPSGVVLTAIGPSLLGEFVIFSLFAFLGLIGFVVAFHRVHPEIELTKYARWLWLFPSLWYWPSSVGKDSMILLGMGLSIWGFVGKNGRMNWILLATGILLIFVIRPQVAAVLILSLVLAHWLSLGGDWTLRKKLQGAAILLTGMGGLWLSLNHMGVSGFDVDGIQGYMEEQSEGASAGGSAVGSVRVGPAGIPMALINVLARPFIWEARNIMALISAVEILGFWTIVWLRRDNFVHALKTWRADPLLRVALPFIVIYAMTLGMLLMNLGIIARQRVFLFPLLFLFVEASPAPAGRRRRSRRSRILVSAAGVEPLGR